MSEGNNQRKAHSEVLLSPWCCLLSSWPPRLRRTDPSPIPPPTPIHSPFSFSSDNPHVTREVEDFSSQKTFPFFFAYPNSFLSHFTGFSSVTKGRKPNLPIYGNWKRSPTNLERGKMWSQFKGQKLDESEHNWGQFDFSKTFFDLTSFEFTRWFSVLPILFQTKYPGTALTCFSPPL